MRTIATLGLAAILGATVSLLSPTSAVAQPKIELRAEGKVDLVEAMKEFARWVAAVFAISDAASKEAKRTAVAEIGTDLVEMAQIKRAIGRSYLPQEDFPSARQTGYVHIPFAGGADLLAERTDRLEVLVKNLNGRLREVDPDWRQRNVETLGLAFQVTFGRAVHVSELREYLVSVNAHRRTEKPLSFSLKEFVAVQEREAVEIEALARQIMASAQVAPTR